MKDDHQTFILDFELIRTAAGSEVNETLLTIIVKAILVTGKQTRVNIAKMIDPAQMAQTVCDARHMAALLIYEETFKSAATKKMISELFGVWQGEMVSRAQMKNKHDVLFARKMKALRARFANIVIAEYDKEIPF